MKKANSELPIIGKKRETTSEKKKRSKKKKLKQKEEIKTKEMPPLNRVDNKNKKIENIIDECGIPMAFNVIFSELISKQIMPENFFKYTAIRLKEIGKEIEGLKVEEPIYIERLKEKIPEKRFKTEGDKVIKNGNLFMTEQQGKKPNAKFNG